MSTTLRSKPEILASIKTLALQAVDDIYDDYRDYPWEDPVAYARWVAQTFHYVKHATRLLSFAASRCALKDEVFHQRLLHGAREEGGHELLALNDLKALGMDAARFPEFPETAAYHQTLYYAIDHDGPAALIGYFLPLEGAAGLKMGPELERVCAAHTAKAASFLVVHCKLDVGHFAEGLSELKHLGSEHLLAVEANIERSVALYRGIIRRLWQEARLVPAAVRAA